MQGTSMGVRGGRPAVPQAGLGGRLEAWCPGIVGMDS